MQQQPPFCQTLFRQTPALAPELQNGLAVFASRHAPGFSSGILRHHFAKLLLVRSGLGWLKLEGLPPFTLRCGTLAVISADVPHQLGDSPGSPLILAGICVDPAVALSEVPLASLWEGLLRGGVAGATFDLGRRASAAERAMASLLASFPAEPIRVMGWFRLMLAEIVAAQAEAAGADPMADIISWLGRQAHLPVKVDELAERCGKSYRSFTVAFKLATGLSVVGYIHQVRIDDACQRLLAGEPLVHAAYSCGFNDLAQFHRVFKRILGLTPREWLRGQN